MPDDRNGAGPLATADERALESVNHHPHRTTPSGSCATRPTEPDPGESRWAFMKRLAAWDAEADVAIELEQVRRLGGNSQAPYRGLSDDDLARLRRQLGNQRGGP